MKKLTLGFVFVVTTLIIMSVPAVSEAQDAAAGKAVYEKKCQTCHAADGTGSAGMAKALKLEFRSLGSDEVQKNSDADLKKIMSEGMGKMKGVMGLSPADMNNLVAHLRTLKTKK